MQLADIAVDPWTALTYSVITTGLMLGIVLVPNEQFERVFEAFGRAFDLFSRSPHVRQRNALPNTPRDEELAHRRRRLVTVAVWLFIVMSGVLFTILMYHIHLWCNS